MFERKEWKDHIIDGEQTYSLQEVPGMPGKYIMVPDTMNVIQEGTPISASNMNRIETGINEAHQTLDTIENQVEELTKDKVKRYGVVFTGSVSKGTRVEDAVGMVANVAVDDEIVINDFDNIPFFNRRICCGVHDASGNFKVNAYRGEPGFSWDGDKGEVYYEETPFYWKGDLRNYVSVSATPIEGYELSPRFKNGVDKEYSPVFWASIVDLKPTSRSGTFPARNSVDGHMTDARKYHAKAHLETIAARMSDYILQLVEFATKDLQTVMMGASSMAYANSDNAALIAENAVNRIVIADVAADRFVVGQTVAIGTNYSNGSIADNRIITSIIPHSTGKKAINFDGAAVNIAIGNVVDSRAWRNGATNIVKASSGSPVSNTSGKYPCIWRGRVDPWGNAFSAISDVLIKRTGAGTVESPYAYTPFFLPDPTKYATGAITADYIELNYKLATADGYAKALGLDSRYKHVRLTSEVGGSSTSGLAAWYSYPRYDVTAVFAGGGWGSGRYCSPVYFACHDLPSHVNIDRMSRLFVSRS